MQTKEQQSPLPYERPTATLWQLHTHLNVLEHLSIQGDVEDFVDGDDL